MKKEMEGGNKKNIGKEGNDGKRKSVGGTIGGNG